MKYPLRAQKVEAQYTTQIRVLCRGNPWIEALPDNPDDKQLYKALSQKLDYEEERQLPEYERLECINGLTQIFIPLGQSADVARKIMAAVRDGYITRNPIINNWPQHLGSLQKCVQTKDPYFRNVAGVNANASGFCVVGDSGMGKTSAVNHALALLPQMILHDSYQGMAFPSVQLVWMRLECPQDASVKGLCCEFFLEFDRITGDNTYSKYAAGGRSSVDQLIPQMALVAQRHGVGLLIIDEIQNLSAAKSGGAQKLLNVIVQLVNTIGLPVLLVGTPLAIGLLSADLMTARRSSGQQGMIYLHALEKGTYDWDSFTKGLWKYQWTKEKAPITDALKDTLHDLSHGNIDAAVKLYMEAQRIAIQKGDPEIITVEALREAASSDAYWMVLRQLEQAEHARASFERQKRNAVTKPETMTGAKRRRREIQNDAEKETPTPIGGISPIGKKGRALLDHLTENGQLVTREDEF